MFFPVLGISAGALALIRLGTLAVTVAYLKAMLAITASVALLLGLGHVLRWHKDREK